MKPWSLATTGFGHRSAAPTFLARWESSSGVRVMNPGMSPPAVKAFSPAPPTTMTRTESSVPSSPNTAASWSRAVMLTRFIFSGTSSVIVAMPLSASRSTWNPS